MGLIITPFGFGSSATEVVAGIDLTGKRTIVTVGIETARVLAGAGAEVTLAVRRVEAGEKIATEIRESTGNSAVSARRLDLSDQGSIRQFVADWEKPLHILVNNAGIMALPALERTREGWEMQFATTKFGPRR
jgi:NAD(P)-dependent dehydrogenase (short-subunit alcohol dehydrogenase family)